MDILFKNITVVTMDSSHPVLTNVDIGVDGRKICYISTTTDSPSQTPKRTIDGTHKVLMPGLYNCHSHAAMTLLRGYAGDKTLEDWLFNHIVPMESKIIEVPGLIRTGTLLAIAEMIASGTIAMTDMYFDVDIVARAADEAGILANVSNAVVAFDKDHFDLTQSNEYEQTMRAISEYHNKGDGRINVDASIHGVYTSFPNTWTQVVDWANQHQMHMHVHLSETKTEHENCIKTFGTTPAQSFNKYGVFDIPTLAAHGVWVSDEDIEILAEKGVTVAHNPLSNLKLASGLAPVDKMAKKGVNVAIGTDGMASNNAHDLFEELKMASLLQKYATNDPTASPAYDTLMMATRNGAKSQGRGHESGMIKVGYDADMIMLDFNNPRQTMCYDPVANLAYSTSGQDVQMTLCRGKVLYEKGEYKTIDIEKILYDARTAMDSLLRS